MLEQRTLADIIRDKVPLGPENARGWFEVRCPCCSDYQVRAGFKFEETHTVYSCWNCKSAFNVEEGTGKFTKNARGILEDFGITRDDLTAIRSALLQPQKEEEPEINLEELKKVKLITPEVALPDRTYLLGVDHHDELQEPLIEYLLKRKIDPLEIRACFSLDPRHLRRVIIPYYRDGKVIYWQSRTIDNIKPRYLNSSNPRDAILYGYDLLYTYTPTPLFVCEGVFDAIVLKGVCILGSTLNAAKLEILKKSRRRIIFVMDPDGNGEALTTTAMENGWEISYFDKRDLDASAMVEQYGLPLAIYQLMKNVTRNPIMQRIGLLNNGTFGTYR